MSDSTNWPAVLREARGVADASDEATQRVEPGKGSLEAATIQVLADEVERLQAVIQDAVNHVGHDYAGSCPDDIQGWDSRDPHCAACRALMALEAEVTP